MHTELQQDYGRLQAPQVQVCCWLLAWIECWTASRPAIILKPLAAWAVYGLSSVKGVSTSSSAGPTLPGGHAAAGCSLLSRLRQWVMNRCKI